MGVSGSGDFLCYRLKYRSFPGKDLFHGTIPVLI